MNDLKRTTRAMNDVQTVEIMTTRVPGNRRDKTNLNEGWKTKSTIKFGSISLWGLFVKFWKNRNEYEIANDWSYFGGFSSPPVICHIQHIRREWTTGLLRTNTAECRLLKFVLKVEELWTLSIDTDDKHLEISTA